jgi:hypothetical protein
MPRLNGPSLCAALALVSVACDPGPPVVPEPPLRELAIVVTATARPAIDELAILLPADRIAIRTRPDPIAALDTVEDPIAIALLDDRDCIECYEIERAGDAQIVVHGDAPLGLVYGLAAVLEAIGIRFAHPFRTHVPAVLAPPSTLATGVVVAPEIATRGLQLHVIHPIEAYFAVWEPGDQSVEDARRIFAWIAANRGNVVHWPGLDDLESPGPAEVWRAHTRILIERAHRLGLRVGLAMQLFGASNLQRGFDLVDRAGDPAPQIEERLDILRDVPFDDLSVSFGEFFALDPAAMVATLDLAYDGIQARWPGAPVGAHVHVGASPSLRVTWMGDDIPYYFLAARADPAIVPWIHTVMYYDLFEDAGGAYLHDDFAEHRELLFETMRAGREVAYYPESAYWVAFDNSVPTYLPLYLRSRFVDLDGIRDAGVGALPMHLVFSSGWEWGYWQNDAATLRMSHTLPARWDEVLGPLFPAEWPLAEVTAAIVDLTTAQHQALIVERLAPWYAGRDTVIDFGERSGIIGQPTRPSYETILALGVTERATFVAAVIDRLDALAVASEAALDRLRASGVPESDPFAAELIDGFEIDVARAAFGAALLRAVIDEAEGRDPIASIAAAEAALATAQTIVARRYAGMHHRDPALLVAARRRTAGLYDYGYLRDAHSLCFWERERAQVRNLLLGETTEIPGCVL